MFEGIVGIISGQQLPDSSPSHGLRVLEKQLQTRRQSARSPDLLMVTGEKYLKVLTD